MRKEFSKRFLCFFIALIMLLGPFVDVFAVTNDNLEKNHTKIDNLLGHEKIEKGGKKEESEKENEKLIENKLNKALNNNSTEIPKDKIMNNDVENKDSVDTDKTGVDSVNSIDEKKILDSRYEVPTEFDKPEDAVILEANNSELETPKKITQEEYSEIKRASERESLENVEKVKPLEESEKSENLSISEKLGISDISEMLNLRGSMNELETNSVNGKNEVANEVTNNSANEVRMNNIMPRSIDLGMSEATETKTPTKASVKMYWLEGNEKSTKQHISQDWQSGSSDMRARIEYGLESDEDFKPGELEISIPKTIYKDRNGMSIGRIELAVPRFPKSTQKIAYIEKEDEIVLVNVQPLPKTTEAFVELTYKAVSPEEVKDLITGYTTDEVVAAMTVNHKNETIERITDNLLTSDVNTKAELTSIYTSERYPYEVYPDIFPAEFRPTNDSEYVYADYVADASFVATQPFKTKFAAEVTGYNGIILGIQNSYNSTMIKGNNTAKLEAEIKNSNDFKPSSSRTFGMRVFVAYPASQFTEDKIYNLPLKMTYEMTSVDDNNKTTRTGTRSVPYKPIKFVAPDNHFGIVKYGDGNNKTWNGYKYEGEYNYAINQLNLDRDTEITYDTSVRAFNLPFTYPSWNPKDNNKDENLNNYKQRQFTTIVQDGKVAASSAGELDYNIKDIRISSLGLYDYIKYPTSTSGYFEGATGNIQYGHIPIGQFGYKSYSSLNDLSIKDKSYEFKVLGLNNGQWIEYADVDISNGIRMNPKNGATVDGSKLAFPDGIKEYKTSLKSGIPGYNYRINFTVAIKANNVTKQLAEQRLVDISKSMERIRTDGDMVGITDTNQELQSKPDYAHDRLMGAAQGMALNYTLDYRNDVDYARVRMNYRVTMTDQTNLSDMKELQEAIGLGALTKESNGDWFILLPKGFDLDLTSVKTRNGDSLSGTSVIKNYKDSGRDLLQVNTKINPNYKMKFADSRDGSIIGYDGYSDQPYVTLSGYYSWVMMKHFAEESNGKKNYLPEFNAVYKSSNTQLGNVTSYKGEDSSATKKNNKYTIATEILKDVTGKADSNNSYLYTGGKDNLSVDTAALVGISKLVDVNSQKNFSAGTSFGDNKEVYESGYYTYRITMTTDGNTRAKDVVIYDKLDAYTPEKEDSDFEKKQWKGTLKNVDTSFIDSVGVKPVIYYSTDPNLNLNSKEYNSDMDLTNGKWTTTKPANSTAVAIDLSKTKDGLDYVMKGNDSTMIEFSMKAPKMSDEVTKDSYAFNTSSIAYKIADINDKIVVNSLKTKVGIKPFNVKITNTWDDGNDRDGKRPENVTFKLYRDGVDINREVTFNNISGDSKVLNGLEYQDEKGMVHNYTLKAVDGSKDYKVIYSNPRVNGDTLEFNIVNKHEPEKITVQGKKVWTSKKLGLLGLKTFDESYLTRPANIKVHLYKDGVEYKSTVVVPDKDNNWNIAFPNEYKYENKKEINYTLKEEGYIPGYAPAEYSQDGRTITNEYYPLGDLKFTMDIDNATPKAKEKVLEYVVEIQSLGEGGGYVTDPNNYKWDKGSISSGGRISLKDGEEITIKDLPTESKVKFMPVDAPGFKVTSVVQEVNIKAGRIVSTKAARRYDSSGQVILKGTKKVDGKKVEPFMFLFELTGNGQNQSVRNDSKGDIYFEPIEYTTADLDMNTGKSTKTYVVSENQKPSKGYTLDSDKKNVVVEISDNGDGTITAVQKGDTVEFTNVYKAKGQGSFDIVKEIKNYKNEIDLSKVKFGVKKDGKDLDIELQASKNGTPIVNKYTEQDIGKTYNYEVYEKVQDTEQFKTNNEVVKFSEKITDNGNGTLSVQSTYLGRFKDGVRVDPDNEVPAMVNELKDGTVTITKNVDPLDIDKAKGKQFKFKVIFKGDKEIIPKNITVNRTKSNSTGSSSGGGSTSAVSDTNKPTLRSRIMRMFSGPTPGSRGPFRSEIDEGSGPPSSGITTPNSASAIPSDAAWKTEVPNDGYSAYIPSNDDKVTFLDVTNSYNDGLKIKYHSNNGETKSFIEEYLPKAALTEEKFAENKQAWGNPGKVLLGWAEDKQAAKPTYKVNAPIKDSDIYTKRSTNPETMNLVELYGIWGKPGYTIKFDKNGGSGSMADAEAIYDEATILPNNTFYQSGKKWIGWAESADGPVIYNSDTKITKSEAQVTDGSITLYAVWEDNDLRLNSETGEFEFTLENGEIATISDIPGALEYEIIELPDPSWGLIKSENTTGFIRENKPTATFTNKYGAKSATVTLGGIKYVDGVPGSLDEFQFRLVNKSGNPITVDETVKANNVTGKFNFTPIIFNNPGTYSFTISEVESVDSDYTTDTKTWDVNVTVKDEGGQFVAMVDNDSSKVRFDNTIKSLDFTLVKSVFGDWIDREQKFEFSVEFTKPDKTVEKHVVSVSEDSTYTFKNLPLGTKYKIIELSKGNWTSEIGESQPGSYTFDGNTLEGSVVRIRGKGNASGIEWINNSTLSKDNDTSTPIEMYFNKELIGRDIVNGEFRFNVTLYNGQEAYETLELENDTTGKVYIPMTEYKMSKVDKIVISEIKGTDPSIEYDGNTATFIKQGSRYVLDGNDVGTPMNEFTFTNRVKPGSITVSLEIENPTEKSKEVQVNPTIVVGGVSNEYGAVSVDSPKTNEYPSNSQYTLGLSNVPEGFELVRIDNDSGTIQSGTTTNVKIVLRYKDKTTANIIANKVVLNSDDVDDKELLSKYQFKFLLLEDGKILSTAMNDTTGKIEFNTIEYTKDDIGKVFKYNIREKDDGQFGIEFDKGEKFVYVKVLDNGSGLLADVKYSTEDINDFTDWDNITASKDPIKFTNKYRIPVEAPNTGLYNSILVLSTMSVAVLVAVVLTRKRRRY